MEADMSDFAGLKTVRDRLAEIESEMAKVSEWKSGDSSVMYRRSKDLQKEYDDILALVSGPSDLDRTVAELKIARNTFDGRIYALQR